MGVGEEEDEFIPGRVGTMVKWEMMPLKRSPSSCCEVGVVRVVGKSSFLFVGF